nr:immunoglobulin light chain junction region [Macaca mulatta]
CQQGYSTLTF